MTIIDLTNSPTPSPVKQFGLQPLPALLKPPSSPWLAPPPVTYPANSPPPLASKPLPAQPAPQPRKVVKLSKAEKEINGKIDQLSKTDLRRLAKALVSRSPEALQLAQGMLHRPKRPRDEVLECENCGEGFKIDDPVDGMDCFYHPGTFDADNCYNRQRGKRSCAGEGDCGEWSCCADDLACGYDVAGCTRGHRHEEMREFKGVRL